MSNAAIEIMLKANAPIEITLKALEARRVLRDMLGDDFEPKVKLFRDLMRDLVMAGAYPSIAAAMHGMISKMRGHPQEDIGTAFVLAAFALEAEAGGVRAGDEGAGVKP